MTDQGAGGIPALLVTSTLPAVTTAPNCGAEINTTSVGSSNNEQDALYVRLNSGYTGSGNTAALSVLNGASSQAKGGHHANINAMGGGQNSIFFGASQSSFGSLGTITDGSPEICFYCYGNAAAPGFSRVNSSKAPARMYVDATGTFHYQTAPPGTADAPITFADKFTINAAGTVAVAGNIGIGTTSPSAALEVNGTVKFDQPVTFASGQTFSSGVSVAGAIVNQTANTCVLSSGNATATCDTSLSNVQQIKPVGRTNITTVTITNFKAGYHMDLIVCQDETGGSTVNLSAAPFHGAMTVGTTAGRCSAQSFASPDGTNLYALSAGVVNQ